MISEKDAEVIIERLIQRTNKANIEFLKAIAEKIKLIRDLTPAKAYQLVQILKYEGSYDEIVRQIAKILNMNVNDMDEIFSSYARKDQMFYEKFYKYKDIPFVPYEQNTPLKMQTEALKNIAKDELKNFTRMNVLGYTIYDVLPNGKKGKLQFIGLRETYNRVLDEALLNVGRGKETFDQAMSNILTQLGGNGLKTLNYESGRNVRLDSAVSMHLKGRLRELHNENQKIYGKQFGSDGVEISVHENPAVDHQDIQGRQFSNEQFENLQKGMYAKDVNGIEYTLDHDHKNGYRPISEMNCYHYVFSIVLGVSKPEYTDKQLKEIQERNNKGFEIDGKHYTMYEGTQVQRNLERRIREQKDIQILAKASDNQDLLLKSQANITKLTNKYKEFSEKSGLGTRMDRLKVIGYRRNR